MKYLQNQYKSTVLFLAIGLTPFVGLGQSHAKQVFKTTKADQLKASLFDKTFKTAHLDSVHVYLNQFLNQYPEALHEFKYRPDALYGNIAERMAEEKKWDKYEFYHSKLSAEAATDLDYVIAGDLLKGGSELPLAEKLAFRSLQHFEKIHKKDLLTVFKPDSAAVRNSQKYKYGEQALLYAELAYRNKHDLQALAYALKSSEIKGGNKSGAYELYLKLLANTAEPSIALNTIEAHYKAGNVNDDELPGIVAKLYKKIHSSDVGFDAYYTGLHGQLLTATKARLAKEKTAIPAPDFSLVNMKGETVKLADMKGKIVVLDFWATWCVYCKKGFPAMQQMINKYSSTDKVVFLFINTQESLTDNSRAKQIANYIIANKYNFNILLDKKESAEYETSAAYRVEGLPTKFVIDGNGNITFKEVGYSGSDEKLINDLSTMIDLSN